MKSWKIAGETHLATLTELLSADFQFSIEHSDQLQLTVLDDFDWHIWRSGCLLVRRAERQLQFYRGRDLLAELEASPNWRFWWQLPKGELVELVQQRLGVRAFVPRYRCQLVTTAGVIRNDDEKIVARLQSRSFLGAENGPVNSVEIVPLRGYQKDLQHISRILGSAGIRPATGDDLRSLLLESGMQVSVLPTKPTFELAAQELAESAVLRMAALLVELARQQEAGLLADIDSEFTHQYRINIRKARSLLSLFKKCLSAERWQRLKVALKEIGSATNLLRDLDVFLLAHDDYVNMLPEDFTPGLKQLFDRIKRRRVQVLKQTVTRISSDAYQARTAELLDLLRAPADLATRQAGLPIKPLVSKKVLSQYRQLCRDGLAIDSRTADEAVHALRIESKKLRYLLELFAELYPKGQIKQLVALLKGLQDNLGRFNDFSVQAEFLREYAQRGRLSTAQQAGISGLVAVLFNRQRKERSQVEANIATFAAAAVAGRFQQLFAADPQEK